MAKSLRKMVTDAAELVAIADLTTAQTVAVSVYGGHCISIQLKPLELVRVSRFFEVPRSKVKINDDGGESINVSFRARGAHWCCVIWRKDIVDFYVALGADRTKLEVEMAKRIGQQPTVRNLTHESDLLESVE